jgi:hypothetical protein
MPRPPTPCLAAALLLALGLGVFAAPAACPAGEPHRSTAVQAPPEQCLAAIDAAQQRYDTPPGLLRVIAKVESGRADASGTLQPWPWTVDADGQGIFFPTEQAAIGWARQALAAGSVTYLDIGCMQVDLRMHPTAFRSLQEAFDPAINADYGARFLKELHDGAAGGNWFTAIGLYHSSTPELAATYRTQVAAVAAGLPMPPPPAGHGIMKLDLVGGGVLRINFNRQPARVHRHLTPCQINAILGSYLPRRVAGCPR